MKHFVARTCTVDSGPEGVNGPHVQSQPLASFADEGAFVLLGAPGSGKTEAFKREAQGNGGQFVTVREFLTFDPEPDWATTKLYIDGLDETRAAVRDGRISLDRIRNRLRRLGCPKFRLSCRAADWFGANDRDRLKAVAPNGTVVVLHLDPLTEAGILEFLEKNVSIADPDAFVAEARSRGIEDILRNPQSLEMLAEAVDGDHWPRTRSETFSLACKKLATECNGEHVIASSGMASTEEKLDTAGHICALLLLSGVAGITLPGSVPDHSHLSIGELPRSDHRLARLTVGTKLFASESAGRLIPTHRQVAEFLAAGRLANLINSGLSVRRVLALVSGIDGGIPSELRGLAAWLAALNGTARTEIARRDPVGVVLYGDVQDFTAREKHLVLDALKSLSERDPWVATQVYPHTRLGPLVETGLEDVFRDILTDPARDSAHRAFLELILQALRAGPPIAGLATPLLRIVRDSTWPPDIRCLALDAYMQAGRNCDHFRDTLRSLLNDFNIGVANDNLLGTLLTELYPEVLTVPEVVDYLRDPGDLYRCTRFRRFWTEHLVEQSSPEQMVQLLDLLNSRMKELRSEIEDSPRDSKLETRVPVHLLRRLLEHSPDGISLERLVHWLDFAAWSEVGTELEIVGAGGAYRFFRKWLSSRPHIQKALVAHDVEKHANMGHSASYMTMLNIGERTLFGSNPPQDYGTWCVRQAVSANDDNSAEWFIQAAAKFVHDSDESDRLRKDISGILRGSRGLEEGFERILAGLEDPVYAPDDLFSGITPLPDVDDFDHHREWIRVHAAALKDNEGPPRILHELAMAYLDGFSNVWGETPEKRLRYMVGPDANLMEAAVAGLKGAIQRTDLPSWKEVCELAADGRTHMLAFPFMVGLLEAEKNGGLELSDEQTRLALAVHVALRPPQYLEPKESPPRWLLTAARTHPDVVVEVWCHCVAQKLRAGEEHLTGIYPLVHQNAYAPLARTIAIPLLRVFPIQCRSRQLETLKWLIQAASIHGDEAQFLEVIEAKLTGHKSMNVGQRIYWLAAGLSMDPEAYANQLESYTAGNEGRIRRLMEMTVDYHSVPQAVSDRWDSTALATLIRLIEPYSASSPGPGVHYRVTLPIQARHEIYALIDRLSKDVSDASRAAMESLLADEGLTRIRSRLLHYADVQRRIHLEATFRYPSLEQIDEALRNGRPANPGDLWALTRDILGELAEDIRDGANSTWKQFWNVDEHNRPKDPKPENACRDLLCDLLDRRARTCGIALQTEGRYTDGTRADIRVTHGEFNVPIEAKRSCHRKLWSSIRSQLVAKYARDPGAAGHGIYLVFWFGNVEECRPTPRSGPKPQSAKELQDALEDTLDRYEGQKIAVRVVDVSMPPS